MKKFLLTSFLAILPFIGWSQKTVTGKIIDEMGLPLPGTTIIEQGTQNGVSADFDGIYSIEISNNSTLEFSFIGYGVKKIDVGSLSDKSFIQPKNG